VSPEDLEWLLGEGVEILAELQSSPAEDALALGTALRKRLPAARARLVQEQLELRERAVVKFGDLACRMLFTRRLLEQATGAQVARHKVERFKDLAAHPLFDLCCGAGGDALSFFQAGLSPTLVDQDPVALALAHHNLAQAGYQAHTLKATLPELPETPGVFHLDPDRRAQGHERAEDRWDAKGLSPDPAGIRQILSRCPDGAIKLSPGTPPEVLEISCEREFVGVRDEARELVLWCGALGEPGLVRATEFGPEGRCETWATSQSSLEEAFQDDPAEEPLEYLHEPVKALVRSHLFAAYGQSRGLCLLDATTAWLTGAQPLESTLLKSYRILAHAPLTKNAETRLLQETGRSCGAVKKRGVAVVPEDAQRQLRKLEGPPAILAYFRVRGRKWCAVLEPAGG